MKISYVDEANRFFLETEAEMDPDAALFIKFFRDPTFWLWFGDELRSLASRSIMEDASARPELDRYLHGLICADKFSDGDGTVIRAMTEVLSHTPEVFSRCLCLPRMSMRGSLDDDRGPHSRFGSSRFMSYLWEALGSGADSVLSALTGPLEAGLTPLVISATLNLPTTTDAVLGASEDELRTGLAIRILTAVNELSLPGSEPRTVVDVLGGNIHENINREGYLSWPEWQLLPLLTGGIEYARTFDIDLIAVSRSEPIGGGENSIWSAAFLVGHAASSNELHEYFCETLLPTGDPAEVMKGIWSMGTAMGKWAPGYIEANREVFFATEPPSSHSLESLIRHGVEKRTVMSHPGFSREAKGRILSSDLGI